jgi:hypothetical protein
MDMYKKIVKLAVCARVMTKSTIYVELYCVFDPKDDDMKMSCQCFAGMLIHLRFGKFLALCIGHICSKAMPKICMTADGTNSLAYIPCMR